MCGWRKFLDLFILILLYEAVGTPFAYNKFSGGLAVEFVGFYMDYDRMCIGITVKRGDWLVEFLRNFRLKGYTISMRRFSEFLGRLAFVCRVLLWIKPHLAPLYSWSAALDRGVVATAPKMVRLACMYLENQFAKQRYMFSCKYPVKFSGDRFRTDAKCDDGRVVLAGFEVGSRRWFALELSQNDAPYLFKADGTSQWASAPAELLAVLVALHCFGYFNKDSQRTEMEVWIQAGTDNKSNEALLKKRSTTRWPLLHVGEYATIIVVDGSWLEVVTEMATTG